MKLVFHAPLIILGLAYYSVLLVGLLLVIGMIIVFVRGLQLMTDCLRRTKQPLRCLCRRFIRSQVDSRSML
jgi:signal transduction histidine kinase